MVLDAYKLILYGATGVQEIIDGGLIPKCQIILKAYAIFVHGFLCLQLTGIGKH